MIVVMITHLFTTSYISPIGGKLQRTVMIQLNAFYRNINI